MKQECDKRKQQTSYDLYIYIYSNNGRHPVTKSFTPVHYTYRHFTSSHLNNIYIYIYIYINSNNSRHPVTNTFTPLHYTCRQFSPSHLNFTQLHFTILSFGLTPFKCPIAPFHLISVHFTPLPYTSPHFTSLHF